MGKHEEAIKNCNEIMKIESVYETISIKIEAYVQWKKLDKAIELSNQALEKFPYNEEEILEIFVDIYQKMNDETKVKEYGEKLQKLKDLK